MLLKKDERPTSNGEKDERPTSNIERPTSNEMPNIEYPTTFFVSFQQF